LTLTLKRECWAKRRRQNKHRTVDIDSTSAGEVDLRKRADPARGPGEMVELLDTFATARKQLAHLKPDQQKALSLFALGHSYREIANLTGWTYTKVNRCITEGRAKLRLGLADQQN
jgi:DNA-directed RNA polymerase specialized sigma24 family protein